MRNTYCNKCYKLYDRCTCYKVEPIVETEIGLACVKLGLKDKKYKSRIECFMGLSNPVNLEEFFEDLDEKLCNWNEIYISSCTRNLLNLSINKINIGDYVGALANYLCKTLDTKVKSTVEDECESGYLIDKLKTRDDGVLISELVNGQGNCQFIKLSINMNKLAARINTCREVQCC